MVIKNKKASHDYEFIEKYTAGIVLKGTEVKSIRRGKASIKDTFCYFKDGELFIKGMHIAEHDVGENHDPSRDRKLLLTKRELKKLNESIATKGLTVVPLSLFFTKTGFIKLDITLARGKKTHDKREAIKRKDIERENQIKLK